MQVATLFREAATLLGASMELQAPEGPGLKMPPGYPDGSHMIKQEPQQHYQDGTPGMKQEPINYAESMMHKDSLYQDQGAQLMKQGYTESAGALKSEPLDDGYETSGDLDLRAQSEVNKMMSNSLHQQMQQHPHPQLAHNQHHQPLPHHQQLHHQMHPHQSMPQHPIAQHHPHHPHHPHAHGHPHQHPHPHPHGHPHGHPHMHHHPHSHVMQGGSMIKYEMEDPYSFVDEERMNMQAMQCPPVVMQQVPKKRGRKKKIKPEDQQFQQMPGGMYADSMMSPLMKPMKDPSVKVFKERKKHDRFNGMPEEEVSKRTLPDHLTQNLDIVIIGINPGLFAAYKGHHYAGPGNHFWKCLYLSGLTPEPMTADDDYKLLKVGIGFTNMVERATKGSADLTRKEIKEGSQILLEKLRKYRPKIAVFNGKLIFEVFSGKKDFSFGRQPEMVDGTNTYMWVMPSSSARCAQLPRAADKVPFYAALKKFRDYLNGLVPELDEKEVVFSYSKLKNFFEPEVKEEKDGQLCSYGYNGRTGDGLQDMTASVIKKEPGDDSGSPPKKKRGRPKKIKVEGEAPPEKKEKPPKEIYDKDGNLLPKKKRGRPKKVKPELTSGSTPEQKPMSQQTPPQQPSSQSTSQSQSGTTNTPATTSQTSQSSNQPSTPTCFSPPIQSPINLCQQNFPQMYNNQAHSFSGNSSQSPLSNHTFHQSPMQSHNYTQSPQPAPFNHSELSSASASDMNAPVTSEPNLAARSPSTSSIGPQEFEPTVAVQEENSKSSSDIKEETTDTHMECHFSSPVPSKKKSPEVNYQNYDEYSGDSEASPSARYPQRPPSGFAPKPVVNSQDVASKSLSGLESLVDQIPNIGDGETPHTVVSGETLESASSTVSGGQYSDDSAYLSDYPRVSHYSPQYPSTVPTTSSNSNTYTSPSPSMNFSVTSLANSSATSSNETSGSFSVTSLASNYNSSHTVTSSYPNLMGPPHPMGSHHVIEGFGGGLVDRTCRIGSPMEPLANMSGVNMPGSPLPYPYNQYSSPYPGGPPAGFPYSPSHNIHVPSPNFPYPSPYSNSGYPQSSYLQSHVFDRLKNEGRMDIGYGGGF